MEDEITKEISSNYQNNMLTCLAKFCLRILGLWMTKDVTKMEENVKTSAGNSNYVDIERQETSFLAPGSLEERANLENQSLLIQMGAISTKKENKNTGYGCCKRTRE